MKKRTKALSLIMALVMVLGAFAVLPITVGAAGESVNDVTKMYDFMVANDTDSFVKNMLTAGGASEDAPYESYKPVDLAAKGYTIIKPTLDGVVNEGEYQITRNTYATTIWHYKDHVGDITESFSFDEENLYIAFTIPNVNVNGKIRLFLKVAEGNTYQENKIVVNNSNDAPITSTSRGLYLDLWSSGWLDDFDSSTGERLWKLASSGNYAKATTTGSSGDAAVQVEYKLPLKTIAEIFNMDVSDMSTVLYAVGYISSSTIDEVAIKGIVNSIGAGAVETEIKSLTGLDRWSCFPKAITLKSESESEPVIESVNDVTKMYDFMVANDTDSSVKNMLTAGGASAEAPYESYKPADLSAKGYATTKPTLDGVVNEGEYQITRNTYATSMWPYRDHVGDITESFSYDEENLYLAFTLPSVNGHADFPLIRLYLRPSAGDNSYEANKIKVQSGWADTIITGTASTRCLYLDVWTSGWLDDKDSATGSILGTTLRGTGYVKRTIDEVSKEAQVEFQLPLAKIAEIFDMDVSEMSTVFYAVGYVSGNNPVDGSYVKTIANSIGAGAVETEIKSLTGVDRWSCFPKAITLISDNNDNNDNNEEDDAIITSEHIVTADKGSVRYSSDKTGLRFKTTVSKAYLAELEAQGYTNINIGTLIAPTDTIGEGKTLTKLAHKYGTVGTNMLDVKAHLDKPYLEDETSITFTGAIVNIKTKNLGRDFSAVGYVSYEDENGEVVYVYSDFVAERNVSEIALAGIAAGECEGDAEKLAKYQALIVGTPSAD